MTPQEQRIAIAEFDGWTFITSDFVGIPKNSRGNADAKEIPDYLHDLNAIHEVEKKLTDGQHNLFRHHLTETTYLGSNIPCIKNERANITATAPQRAEALLRTIGKWKE